MSEDVNSNTIPLLMNRIDYLRDFLYHANRNLFTVSHLSNWIINKNRTKY